MKKTALLFILVMISFASKGQTNRNRPDSHKKTTDPERDAANVLTYADHMPEFPGGDKKLMSFISEHIKYPDVAKDEGISGRVNASFIILEDGSIDQQSIRIDKSIGGGTDEEVKRVIRNMPKWIPGSHNGLPVKVRYKLPFTFAMQ